MRELSKLDKLLLVLGFLLVVGIFALAIVIYVKGGQCLANPVEYAIKEGLLHPSSATPLIP